MLSNRINRVLFLIVLIGIDLSTKYLATQVQFREIIPNLFNISYVRNEGVIFGFLSGWDNPLRPYLLTSLGIITILYFGYRYFQLDIPKTVILPLGLLLSGALGNVINRLQSGYVIDFIDIYFRQWHYWTFNVADSLIMIGLGLLILNKESI